MATLLTGLHNFQVSLMWAACLNYRFISRCCWIALFLVPQKDVLAPKEWVRGGRECFFGSGGKDATSQPVVLQGARCARQLQKRRRRRRRRCPTPWRLCAISVWVRAGTWMLGPSNDFHLPGSGKMQQPGVAVPHPALPSREPVWEVPPCCLRMSQPRRR